MSPLVLVATLWLAQPPPPSVASSRAFDARVVAIADGDTLTVLRGKEQVKVRLYGIDAPEKGQDFGNRARERLGDLAQGETVRVDPVETDRYGRMVARIILPGGESLNRAMVRDGFAWWYRKYAPGDVALRDAEAEARKAKIGLWSQPSPVAPWDWRSGSGLPPALAGKFIASRRSNVFHSPGCRAIPRIAEKNRLAFDSAEAARKAGLTHAKDCR